MPSVRLVGLPAPNAFLTWLELSRAVVCLSNLSKKVEATAIEVGEKQTIFGRKVAVFVSEEQLAQDLRPLSVVGPVREATPTLLIKLDFYLVESAKTLSCRMVFIFRSNIKQMKVTSMKAEASLCGSDIAVAMTDCRHKVQGFVVLS